jgi:hypothetical protein
LGQRLHPANRADQRRQCQEIWIKAGMHHPTTNPTDRTATFTLKNVVAVYGGFAGTETRRDQRNWQTNPTILSGDIDQNDINTDGNFIAETPADIQGSNAYHVVNSGSTNSTAILDGFAITAGQANGSGSGGNGGGIVSYASSPTLVQLVIVGNTESTAKRFFYRQDAEYAEIILM